MAFNIFPKSHNDINDLPKYFNKRTEIKKIFDHAKEITGDEIESPICISDTPKLKNTVKIIRCISDEFDFDKLKNETGMIIKSGDGSRGGKGVNNKGKLFEKQIFNDLKEFQDNPLNNKNLKYPNVIQKINNEILSKHKKSEIEILAVGHKDYRRPLQFNNQPIIGDGEFDIGNKISDITINIKNKENQQYFLSLKSSGTVTFANSGIKTIMPEKDFKKGKLSKQSNMIMDMLGIDIMRFIDIFNSYKNDTYSARSKINPEKFVDQIPSFQREKLEQFLKSGIGYGYWMIHKKGKDKVDITYMDQQLLNKTTKIRDVKIAYPKLNTNKRIDIIIETDYYTFNVNIRNKYGDVYPSNIMIDYKAQKT